MMKIQPVLMEGMMAKNADVAWICSIPHHQGAIDMARAGLREADNPESKQFRWNTIKATKVTRRSWSSGVEKYAAQENRNETTSTSK